ncbi:MAG: Uma2 family endonuclease [Cyanobacteria bacterium]|jgi:Uma2 family endonuclease|nr:Uma2 family endonuclease [Cyanobacteria bacterium GSL.Bin1]
MTALTLNLSSLVDKISDRQLEHLSRDNPDARLETNSRGQLIFMSPTGGETSEKNSELIFQVQSWNKQSKLGKVFDSSGGFKLSNEAIRSPDVSWISISKWNTLSHRLRLPKREAPAVTVGKEQRKTFLPVEPDFVIELMSPTDVFSQLQQKMKEYINCGVKLGWLINPDARQVEIYHQGKEKEVLDHPQTLSGEDILPGLVVDLTEIFD